MICYLHGCENPAAFRFTWPGRDEETICAEHAPKLRGIASAMGFHCQLIPIEQPAGALRADPNGADDGDTSR